MRFGERELMALERYGNREKVGKDEGGGGVCGCAGCGGGKGTEKEKEKAK